MTPNELSILIPTRNRAAILRRTIEELLRAGFGQYPLLVYDDASDDPKAVAEIVKLWTGPSRIFRSETRTGQARGRNILMGASTSEFVLFLDDDSWPESHAAIINALEVARADALTIATFHYRSLGTGALSVSPKKRRTRTSMFLGGASLFRVSDVLKVGGFRERFIYGYEEPELAMRLWVAGYQIEYLPGIVVVHNQFYTPEENRDYREYDYLYARNSILMSSLNMPFWFGLPHGLIRSVRRSAYQRRSLRNKIAGTVSGVWLSISLWKERSPCSISKTIQWCQFVRNQAK